MTSHEKFLAAARCDGDVPHIDHAVSQDISWNNFTYYRERLNALIDTQD